MGSLHDLTRAECWELLADRQVGRVAVVAPDGPHIVTVNYALVEDAILVRTSPFTLLGTHGRDADLAFEVDAADDRGRTGWSVLVRGRSQAVYDSREIEHIRRVWDPDPWADGNRNLYLRISATEVSGRRIGPGASAAG